MRIGLLIAAYAVIAVVAYVFLRPMVPPCFGVVPNGEVSKACYDAWLAREWLARSPYPEIAGFVAAAALTIWWSRRRAP
jgi:hypothetical protein